VIIRGWETQLAGFNVYFRNAAWVTIKDLSSEEGSNCRYEAVSTPRRARLDSNTK
jgi:hypothetical protein